MFAKVRILDHGAVKAVFIADLDGGLPIREAILRTIDTLGLRAQAGDLSKTVAECRRFGVGAEASASRPFLVPMDANSPVGTMPAPPPIIGRLEPEAVTV